MPIFTLKSLISLPRPSVCLAVLAFAAYQPNTHAALMLNGTRVIYNSDKRSTSVIVGNPSEQIFAVQSWINTEADNVTTPVPFIAAPALFRLDPGKEQLVQVNGLPNQLPRDRESLFYLNVQEIPQAGSTGKNILSIALRTRIKLFYRPAELKDTPTERLADLRWSLEQINGKPHLVVNNPGPFHISFSQLEVHSANQREKLQRADMAAPLSRQTFALATIKPADDLEVTFTAINDYGGHSRPISAPVQTAP